MLSKVVRGPHRIALSVRKLTLDDLMVPALFVKQRRCHATKAVAGHFLFVQPPCEPGLDAAILPLWADR